ncbi:hypothetical protein [Saccharopolyspora pogona]|uniref:hypothetical protein n=1 Tax=Saccharopolyspora pogona TaxID=333966 RepID=UPI001682A526|nr:hypothetical protein [Saccharopolyspora pogona]
MDLEPLERGLSAEARWPRRHPAWAGKWTQEGLADRVDAGGELGALSRSIYQPEIAADAVRYGAAPAALRARLSWESRESG